MIEFCQGNILAGPAEALVNAVNTVGVMSKGLALQFRERFPERFASYARACAEGELVAGKMHVFDRGAAQKTGRWISNVPTKRHWRGPIRMAPRAPRRSRRRRSSRR